MAGDGPPALHTIPMLSAPPDDVGPTELKCLKRLPTFLF